MSLLNNIFISETVWTSLPMRSGPETRVVLADKTAPADSASLGEVQEELGETVVGGEAVQQTGGVGEVVVVQLAVLVALGPLQVLRPAYSGRHNLRVFHRRGGGGGGGPQSRPHTRNLLSISISHASHSSHICH